MKLSWVFLEYIRWDEAELRELIWISENLSDASDDPDSSSQLAPYVDKLIETFRDRYGSAVFIVRSAKSAEDEAMYWKIMIRLCSSAIQAIAPLRERFPHCRTLELYDRVLTCKLAYDDRYREVMEEMALEKDLPEGLLSRSDLLDLACCYVPYCYAVDPAWTRTKEFASKFNNLVRYHYENRVVTEHPSLSLPEFICVVKKWCKAHVNKPYKDMKIRTVGSGPSWALLTKSVFAESVL